MRAWRGYLLMVLGFVVIPGLVAWRTTDAEAQKIFTWAIYNFIVFPLVILAFGALIVLYGIISSWPRTVRRKAAVSPTANEPGQFGPAEVPIAYPGYTTERDNAQGQQGDGLHREDHRRR